MEESKLSTRLKICAVVCTLCILAACGQNKEETPTPPKLFEGQREALERSQAVESLLQEQEALRRREMEQQTQEATQK